MTDAITSFSGDFRWLSNFWTSSLIYKDYKFTSSENAYQWAKSEISNPEFFMCTPGRAKRLGREALLRSDWEEIKIRVMTDIVSAKFEQNLELKRLLIETGDREIIEGNTWGDKFWGECPIGTGKNNLGKILMTLRNEFRYGFV